MSNSSFRKDVSDAEIDRFMATDPIASSLQSKVRKQTFANEEATGSFEREGQSDEVRRSAGTTRSRGDGSLAPRNQGSPDRASPHAPGNDQVDLSDDLRSYLQFVVENDLLTATQCAARQGLSANAASQLRTTALDTGLAVQVKPNLGRSFGGVCSFLMLTRKAYCVLGIDNPWPQVGLSEHERPSPLHIWWQRNHWRWLKQQRLDARLEYEQNGKRADVAVLHTPSVEAWEIELSVGNATRNVLADLKAGFFPVTVAAATRKLRSAIEQQLQSALPAEQLAAVNLIQLSDLPFVAELKTK